MAHSLITFFFYFTCFFFHIVWPASSHFCSNTFIFFYNTCLYWIFPRALSSRYFTLSHFITAMLIASSISGTNGQKTRHKEREETRQQFTRTFPLIHTLSGTVYVAVKLVWRLNKQYFCHWALLSNCWANRNWCKSKPSFFFLFLFNRNCLFTQIKVCFTRLNAYELLK